MRTHTLSRTMTNLRLLIVRYVAWIGLGLVIVGASLAASASIAMPARAPAIVSNSSTSRVDPATHTVLNYLRAHSILQSCPVLTDPAQQGVIDYLRAHGAVLPCRAAATPTDAAVQAVLDYLEVHSR